MEGLQWIAEIAFRHLWQGALILGIVSTLLLYKDKWSAEHRSWIWAAAVLLIGTMPVVTLIPTPSLGTMPTLISGSNVISGSSGAPLTDVVNNAYNYPATLLSPVTETIDRSFMSREMLFYTIIGLWAIFTIRALTTLYMAWQRTRDLRLNAEPLKEKHAFLPGDWPASVTVAVSDKIEGPMAVGLLTPYVMLPGKLIHTLSTEQLRHVLAHELAHIKRGDLLCAFAQRILLAVYWWSPFMHMACNNLRTEREMACDDRAVRMAGCSKNYATSLLDSAESLIVGHRTATNLMAVGAFERGKDNFFSRRIKRLINADYRDDLKLGRPHLAGLTSATAIIALLFVLSPRTTFSAVWPGEEEGVCCDEFIEAILNQDHKRKVELVEEGADLNCIGEEGLSPLVAATHTGDISMVAWLIERGADVNLVTPSDGTPLMEAVAHGRTMIANKLITAGADINVVADGDGTALINAAHKGDADMVHWLLEKGANVNLVTAGNGTALVEAAAHGHTTVVKKLLAAGADPNLFVEGGETALIAAAREGHYTIVKYLVKYEADISFSAWQGSEEISAISEAKHHGHNKIASYLKAQAEDRRG